MRLPPLLCQDVPDYVRRAEDASVQAAAEAARADSVARVLRKADSGREQLLQLKAENDALKALLLELARERDTSGQTKARLEGLLASSLAQGTPLSVSKLLEAAATVAPAASKPASAPPGAAIQQPEVMVDALKALVPEPPPAPAVVNPTRKQLQELSAAALKAGRPVFVYPAEPVHVAGPMFLY